VTEDSRSDRLRGAIAAFDARQKKVLISVVATMMRHSDRVRDREWMAEQFASAVALAHDYSSVEDAGEGIAEVQEYAAAHIDTILIVAYGLFAQVAQDLADVQGFSFEDAMAKTLSYCG